MTIDKERDGAADVQSSFTLRRFAPLFVLVAVAVSAYLAGVHKYFGPEYLAYSLSDVQAFISDNLLLSIGAYMAIYIVVVALSLPGAAVLSLAGGLFFGWQIGMPATIVAATIGAVIIFLIVKTSLGAALAEQAGPWLDKLQDGFRENAFSYLLFLRLVPAFPFVVVNLAPALLGVSLRTFILGTVIGIIPGSFAFTYFGSGLDSVLAAGRASHEACIAEKGAEACAFPFDLGTLITTDILLAFAALAVVALIPVVLKKFSKTS